MSSNFSRILRRLRTRSAGLILAMLSCALAAQADQMPEKANILVKIAAHHIRYYSDAGIIAADGGVQLSMSNGVTVEGDVCSLNLNLQRFLMAGRVHVSAPGGNYSGAAFADFLAFRRAYFIPLNPEPDRWTFLNDDYTHPEKGREMPGDAFSLPDLSGDHPFITAKRVTLNPVTYIELSPATFHLLNGNVSTPPLMPYVRNVSDNPNFFVNSLAGATYDIPYGVAGTQNSLEAFHLRYDQQRKTYVSFEHHSVFGEQGYAVFSLNPATQPSKQWNVMTYSPLTSSNALNVNAQLFTYQYGLRQPLASSGFIDIQEVSALKQSSLRFELTQAYDSLLAPTPLGYYGDPSHPFIPNHPSVAGLSWISFDHPFSRTGLTLRLTSGLARVHDGLGVSGFPAHDITSGYLGGTVYTPVYPGPFNTGINAIYQLQQAWLSFPNSINSQNFLLSASKRLTPTLALVASVAAQSASTRDILKTIVSPSLSSGLVAQPASPNGLPVIGSVPMTTPHASNIAYILNASYAPSPNFQLTMLAQRNIYAPVQVPFVAGPPQYQATLVTRMRISKTLFLSVSRAYYFNWANQTWSPQFGLQLSPQ